jgi:hypothetical protein
VGTFLFRAYVTEVPAVSAVMTPLVVCDVALTTLSESKWLFRFAMLKNIHALAVSNIFIQPPDSRAFLDRR